MNNESPEIIRIFNSAFNDIIPPEKAAVDLYLEALRKEIDEKNAWLQDAVNCKCRHPSLGIVGLGAYERDTHSRGIQGGCSHDTGGV